MSILKMSEQEKKAIQEKHKIAIKNQQDKKIEENKGLQKPEKKKK
jgi:hypothetical protein